MTVIDIVLLSDLVQSIDARITSFQSLGQFGPGSHVLINRPVFGEL